jgi:hypothetical protein
MVLFLTHTSSGGQIISGLAIEDLGLGINRKKHQQESAEWSEAGLSC